MVNLEEFIKECESKGVKNARKSIENLLAERHRDTRYAAIEAVQNHFIAEVEDGEEVERSCKIDGLVRNIHNLKK